MPIKPPNLDDRRYADIVSEARALIPQYCPEWTNLSDADPGMTLVQLFAWMTELTIYRLNRVPDKTYIHFLNFIGEERKRARPAVAPVTFTMTREGGRTELPPFTTCSTRQTEEKAALDYLTTDRITLHDAHVVRVMAVKGGKLPAVREVPFTQHDGHESVLSFAGGRGIQLFDLDPVTYGPDAYTPHQFLYVSHDDLRLMDVDPEGERPVGRLRMRRTGDFMSVVPFFQWEYPTAEGWVPIAVENDEESQLGMDERSLITALPGINPIPFQLGSRQVPLPEEISSAQWWIRGRLDYERWLADRMEGDLEVYWRDDRGGEERKLNNWNVRPRGRSLEFFLQDLPPIKGGWTIRLALVDRNVPAGRHSYLPKYRWYYRRAESWEEIPKDRVRVEGTMVVITGPLTDMATDGFNLRAERIETVFLRGFSADLELDLSWDRPVEVRLMGGDDRNTAQPLELGEAPWSPFQINPAIPPTIGRRFFIGSDLFENRKKAEVMVEVEVGFEMNGELIEEPEKLYRLQLTYRAEDSWRVVWTEDKIFSGFTFADLDPDGAKRAAKRRIRIPLDPKTQLRGLSRYEVGSEESTWLRLELIKSSLTGKDENKDQHPIALKIYSIQLGVEKRLGQKSYEQPMPNPRMAQLDFRDQNQRLTRVVTRATGRLGEFFPFFPFIEIDEPNQALYLQFDRPLPPGERHAIQFRCRGEAFVPSDARFDIEWEILEDRGHGRTGWYKLDSFVAAAEGREGRKRRAFDMSRSGVLEFPLPELPPVPDEGFWVRGRFVMERNADDPGLDLGLLPSLPPVTHMMLNTVNAACLFTMRTERNSGRGVPNQVVQLLRKPIFIHPEEAERQVFERPEQFDDIVVFVENEDGTRDRWERANAKWQVYDPQQDRWKTVGKDARVFVVDPVEGTLTFGNGIRGRMLPVGSNNVLIDVYRVVPGARGNVAPHEIELVEGRSELEVTNVLPAVGGRDAETIDEIKRRAPSILTSRDRAVTRVDFEQIARDASSEVARAACEGRMEDDGKVQVVILPHRREGERMPDPFLAAGLRDHVSRYLKRRCLINVEPDVRLARFMELDVNLQLRVRPNSNTDQVREAAEAFIRAFLDPYAGGLDGEGWPFGGTLYAQDFARMVSEIPEVRHVSDVHLYDMSDESSDAVPGWEEGEGHRELFLTKHDLFVVRRVRVRTEESGQ